jgi:transcriptional regulator with XRE-family HTH domain
MNGLLTKMKNKKYRDSYVSSHLSTGIPHQIRALRVQRGWNQKKLGAKANKPQNVISRVEDPNYGKTSLSTLLDIASAFDVALLVKFVPFSRFIREHSDVHPKSLYAASFDEEFTQTHAPRKMDKVAAEIGEPITDITGSHMAVRRDGTATNIAVVA